MSRKIKLELTYPQFTAMVDMVDTISALSGSGSDFTDEATKNIRLFDRMLKNNGYKRNPEDHGH